MRQLCIILCGALMFSLFSCAPAVEKQAVATPAAPIKGHLFIIGGGERTDMLMEKFVSLAGGPQARILVIPFASGLTLDTGIEQSEQIKEFGCWADYIMFEKGEADLEVNLKKLEGITGIFFSGGDQNRLTNKLLGTQFLERIKEIYRQGGVVGGTSAGAAVMSEIMITGEEAINKDTLNAFPCIKKGNALTAKGFGFVDFAIIDQHFIQRKRENRLLGLVLEYQMPGIGIDESTAIIVSEGKKFEVFGHRSVMVFEPLAKTPLRTDAAGNLAAENIRLSILLSGDSYTLQ